MDSYLISLTIIGIAALGMAWMPSIAAKTKISYSLVYVAIGCLLYSLLPMLPNADPLENQDVIRRLSEIVVIVSIMGTGLKIDEPFSFKAWRVPFRLLSVTMLLSIAAVVVLLHFVLHFDLASSILMGAALAPTDPVLASDVQVGPPMEDEKENVRFSLTAEAGMNDGMAFPFTWLAIALALSTGNDFSLGHWLLWDLLYRIVCGVIVGYLMGRLLALIVFVLPEKNFVVIRDGFVAVAATLMVYGITELLHGYGFIAVFVTAITMRNSEMHHKLHKKLHDFTDQIERILVGIVLILFGGALISGILSSLTWKTILFSAGFLLVIRPLSAMLSLFGTGLHIKEKLAISFFGIRGIGSFFYLAFALSHARFNHKQEMWAILCLIVTLSIFIHGLTATSVMQRLSSRFSEPRIKERSKK